MIDMKDAMQLVAEGAMCSPAQRQALQQQRLRKLVTYVREHSPYFAQHYAGLPENFTLADLPHTEKPTLLEHYNDWVTDRALTLTDVPPYKPLYGDLDDDISILEGPDRGWGRLFDKQIDVIQTDWPALVKNYRFGRIGC